MIEFRIRRHMIRDIRDVNIVEMWRDGVFIGTIAPGLDLTDGTLRVISKHRIESSTLEKDGTNNLNVLTIAITAAS
jgi:hypothetical protein